ncbi:hypothetical protein TTHERM_00189130 (macronuclear) [Tetrahymena thermophila SB210]|uniref:Uncharacterized protein n=1 Tax=Tetrahymena thermophila (strain SB210) TaxID=312017 RepID=I7LUZ2_TETTS|nr:hypothetical protein TTHERM_00189130 [Tetrahymena thermophila SB210]EAR96344.2 hypothetical protein TTHERM_00189130 [Tetrahymena thermophila SB210]|eukprot:XP_001016589.2 hypothetical protein TTHERM_00189130 [Tetrahymena thermophila SB210]
MKKSIPPSQNQQIEQSKANLGIENQQPSHTITSNTNKNQIHFAAKSQFKRSFTPPPFQTPLENQNLKERNKAQQDNQRNFNNTANNNNSSSFIQQTIIINQPNFNINYMQTKNNQYVKNNIDAKGNQIQINTQNINGNQYYQYLNQSNTNTNQQQTQNLQSQLVKLNNNNNNMSFLRSKTPLTPQQIQIYNEIHQQKKQYSDGNSFLLQFNNEDKVHSKQNTINDHKKIYLNGTNQINSNFNIINNSSLHEKSRSPKQNELVLGNQQTSLTTVNQKNDYSRSESAQKQRIMIPNHIKQNTQQPINGVISQLYKHTSNEQKNDQMFKRIETIKQQPHVINNLVSPSKERSQSVKQRCLNRPISQQQNYAPFGRSQTPKPELPTITDFKFQKNPKIDTQQYMNQTTNLIKQSKGQRFHTIGDFDDQLYNKNNNLNAEKQTLKGNGNTAAAAILRNQTIDLENSATQNLLANHLSNMQNTVGIKKLRLIDNLIDNPKNNSQNLHRLSSCYDVNQAQDTIQIGSKEPQNEIQRPNVYNTSQNKHLIFNNSNNKYIIQINQERSKSPSDLSQQSNYVTQNKYSQNKSILKECSSTLKKRPISPQSISNQIKKSDFTANLKQFQQTMCIQTPNTTNLPNNSNTNNNNNNNVQQLLKIYDETGLFKLPNPPKSNQKNTKFQRRYHSNLRGPDNRIKTEMNESLTNSINMLNLCNDQEHQQDHFNTEKEGVKKDIGDQTLKGQKKENGLDKTLDKSFELYFQEDNKTQKFVRTNKDIQNLLKNDFRRIGLKEENIKANKNESYLNTKNNQTKIDKQSRKHSASHYIFSTLQENSQKNQIFQDFCYNFDI